MELSTARTWGLAVFRRLLRIPIFGKILLANMSVVVVSAAVITWGTTLHVQASPHATHYEMMVLFAVGGLLVTLPVNWIILHFALLPLHQVEATARAVQAGDLAARVRLTPLGDPHTDRLAATLNAMLDQLSASAQALQAYAQRLQALSGRVLAAQEAERVRIARELHDQTGQALTSLLIGLRVLRGELDVATFCGGGLDGATWQEGDQAPDDGGSHPAVQPVCARAHEQAAALAELARQALDDVRRLALELRPKTLDDLGLVAALRWYAEEWAQQVGLDVRFTSEGDPSVVRRWPDVEIALYRVVQEALTNVAKHARAHHVTVRLACHEDKACVEVIDDGVGFDPAAFRTGEVDQPGLRHGPGLGLFGMEERMALIGGTLQLGSAPEAGTRVEACAPLLAVNTTSLPAANSATAVAPDETAAVRESEALRVAS